MPFYNKNRMITHVITFLHTRVILLSFTESSLRFLIQTLFFSKRLSPVLKDYLKIYKIRRTLVSYSSYEMITRVKSSIYVFLGD